MRTFIEVGVVKYEEPLRNLYKYTLVHRKYF